MQIRHSLPTNTNLETGIAFGYISASALHPDIVDELQQNGTDVYYEEALKEHLANEKAAQEDPEKGGREGDFDEDFTTQAFNDAYQPDEPIHEGVKDGVKYCTSWLGGALNVWIFESPHITHLARRASPCLPGAAILDTLDGSETGYDVPPEWRVKE